MGKVFLDGEKVDFEGSPPRSVAAAWELVGGYLAQQERIIDATLLEGIEWRPDSDEDRDGWERLEFRSVPLEEKLIALALAWGERSEEIERQIEDLSGAVLTKGWREVQNEIFEMFDGLRPFVDQFGSLLRLGEERGHDWTEPLKALFAACGQSLEAASRAVESEDCVTLSDTLSDSLGPSLTGLIAESTRLLTEGEPGNQRK